MAVDAFLKDDSNLDHTYSSTGVVSEAEGGVAPVGWINSPATTLIDEALNDYDIVWAAAGHPHAVFPTTFAELLQASQATPARVGD